MEKPGATSQKPEALQRRGRRLSFSLSLLLASGLWLLASFCPSARAEPTQEEVLRSIGQNVSEPADSGRVLAAFATMAGAVGLLVVLGQRRSRPARPKVLRHHGKLMKEVLRTVPLKPAEVKQLRQLVEVNRGADAVESPLTLLLCPSVLVKAAQAKSDRINRRVVGGLAKKFAGPSPGPRHSSR